MNVKRHKLIRGAQMNSALLDEIKQLQKDLSRHSLYPYLSTVDAVRLFMESHIFAVWDFMSLLKSLQSRITNVGVPWSPSGFPGSLVRLINELVLAEESDKDGDEVTSHFMRYLDAMIEVGADTMKIEKFMTTGETSGISKSVLSFVRFHLDLAEKGNLHQIAGAFYYGREQLIPLMYEPMVSALKKNAVNFPAFYKYLNRHISLDSGEHIYLAAELLEFLCGTDAVKWEEAYQAAIQSLQERISLWDFIQKEITQKIKV